MGIFLLSEKKSEHWNQDVSIYFLSEHWTQDVG